MYTVCTCTQIELLSEAFKAPIESLARGLYLFTTVRAIIASTVTEYNYYIFPYL